MDTYSKEVIDGKFESLRQEIRGDLNQLRLDITNSQAAIKDQVVGGDQAVKDQVAALSTRMEVLIGQIKVWGFVLGILMPVLLMVVNKLWVVKPGP